MTTYKILRFRFERPTEVIKTGLTLDEAQEHCEDPASRGEGWFDGWTKD